MHNAYLIKLKNSNSNSCKTYNSQNKSNIKYGNNSVKTVNFCTTQKKTCVVICSTF